MVWEERNGSSVLGDTDRLGQRRKGGEARKATAFWFCREANTGVFIVINIPSTEMHEL